MEELPPGRTSSGCLGCRLEARRAAEVQKFLTSASRPCLLPGFQRRCSCCQPSGAPRVLVGSLLPSGSSKLGTYLPASSWQGSGSFPARFSLAPRTDFPPAALAGCGKGRLRWQCCFLLPPRSAWRWVMLCRSQGGQGWRLERGVDTL